MHRAPRNRRLPARLHLHAALADAANARAALAALLALPDSAALLLADSLTSDAADTSSSPASQGSLDDRGDVRAARLGAAAAPTDRALRIAPREARLWQQLARIRLQQGQYQQAESLAARSNTWAGSDSALRAQNWNLIAQARDARGDSAGARAALQKAEDYGR